jgi:hypothetical protein
MNKWWDLYSGENLVILDDLDKAGGQMLSHYMKIWPDKWPFQAEAKGSVVKPEYDYFIVTSNYTPAQIYGMRTMHDTDEEYEAKQTAV